MRKHLYQVVFKGITFSVYDDYVSIEEKGGLMKTVMLGRATGGENKFFYSDISSIHFKKPSVAGYGIIEFIFPGSNAFSNTHGGSFFASSSKQSAFSFSKKEADVMEKAYEFIQDKVNERKTPQNVTVQAAPSSADELVKFKQLLDSGVITQEEFDTKKKQILGL